MRKPSSVRLLTALGSGAVAALAILAACSSSAKLVAKGGTCELATDCVEGLICISNGTSRVCSDDLGAVQKTEAMPKDGSAEASYYDGSEIPDAPEPTDDAPVTVTDSATTTDAAGPVDAAPTDAAKD